MIENSHKNELSVDPLFVGLTRPPMIFGVTIEYAMLNFMISIILFIQDVNIYILFIALITHAVGYILCFKEPRFMNIYINYLNKCNQCPNRSFYCANSYKP